MILSAGGEHDDGHRGEFADAHTGGQPVHLRHHQVQDDEVEALAPGQLDGGRAVEGSLDLIALVLKVEFDALDEQLLVVHH